MPWIIFQWGVDKTRNTEHSGTFRNIPEHPGTFSGLAVKVDWFLGRPFWTLLSGGLLSKRMPRRNNVRERNKRGFHLSYKICQEPVVFALVMRFSGPNIYIYYEATSRFVHNSNPYWTWHVCPIEQFSTQSYTSSLRPVLHMPAFGTKTLWMRVPPTLNFRKDLPIVILTGASGNVGRFVRRPVFEVGFNQNQNPF